MSLIALVGNPNVGKSTLFNALTGLKQHTGNWPGKTVALASGEYTYKGKSYVLVDLPGTYSLQGTSPEEKVTGSFLEEESADCVLVICDGTCLERSLILALEAIHRCPRVMVCVNLLDEARAMGLQVEVEELSRLLGVPVVGVCAKEKGSLEPLQEQLRLLCEGFLPYYPLSWEGEKESILRAQALKEGVCTTVDGGKRTLTEKLDGLLLHPLWAYPFLFLLFLFIFWLTIEGANYPSQGLQWCFTVFGDVLHGILTGVPPWLSHFLMEGIYEPVTRVVAVMLPPMSIFFPVFTLLEDFGYLPRVAFLLDEGFRRCGACGKQALTMCMGFGCNAVGVTGCRIIDSPRERLMGILTNSLVPCNGRFPTLILLLGLSFGGSSPGGQALGLTVLVTLSLLVTLFISRLLHRTVLKGEGSVFVMELPPYRRPKVGQVLLRSLLDRCLRILGRAVAVAAPMGVLIWLMQEISVGEQSLLLYLGGRLEGPGAFLGIGGTVLLAFLLGSPANELVIPIAIMILAGGGSWSSAGGESVSATLLHMGFTRQQGICTMIFMLFHWPCTTTLWTVYKETRSLLYTCLAWLLPTAVGVVLCGIVRLVLSL